MVLNYQIIAVLLFITILILIGYILYLKKKLKEEIIKQKGKRNRKKDLFWGWVMLIIGVRYLVNWGFGVVEFLPDNLPFIGNMDEAGMTVLAYKGYRKIFNKIGN